MAAKKVKIMGILNITPDSFSDGGKFFGVGAAIAQAKKMISEGASIIDVGGESSGPGSVDVGQEEELRRVMPVLKEIVALIDSRFCGNDNGRGRGITVSVDTYKSEVARQAIQAGATMVNDVTALRGDPKMAELVAKTGVKIILMYSKDSTARTTRSAKTYKDVVKTVMRFLEDRVEFALSRGIKKSQIIIDPGMGAFISSIPKYSLEILRRLAEFKKLGFPVLVGVSRKSCLPGAFAERALPGAIASMVAAENGADIIRVHDVLSVKCFAARHCAQRCQYACIR